MYKSKLQELCQKQKWALPKYTSVKDGEDHCPLFKASVVVGGITFDTLAACRSSKQALNEAAQLAFLHFTSEPSKQSGEKIINNEKGDQSSVSSEAIAVKRDFEDEFRKKLEMYVRRKNFDSPEYSTEKEGLSFRARVTIGEKWFKSEGLFESAEEAEDSAAQAALLSLSSDTFHENDPLSYKILLQDLTDEQGLSFPKYSTICRSDKSSNNYQTFSSIVEVGGETFKGDTEKSGKLAELNAAYTAFMERKLFDRGYISPKSSDDDGLKLERRLGSILISDPPENPKTTTQYMVSPLSTADSKTAETRSYLLCNRVKIFTFIPNTALPKGTAVLPVCENRWTIFSLEFPREEGM